MPAHVARCDAAADATIPGMAKGSDKPKHSQKKVPQKTLKERRSDKRAAKKHGTV